MKELSQNNIMNFRFTKQKTIWTIIISLIVGLVLAVKTTGYDMPTLTISGSLQSSLMFWFIVLFIVIYIFWSLFQRK